MVEEPHCCQCFNNIQRPTIQPNIDGDDENRRGGRRSVEGRAVAFANKVNALGLALTKLKPFKERQEYVFKVLGGIGS